MDAKIKRIIYLASELIDTVQPKNKNSIEWQLKEALEDHLEDEKSQLEIAKKVQVRRKKMLSKLAKEEKE